MIKLNLGCGSKKLPGFVNVDSQPMEDPDVVVRLDVDRWPWDDNSVEAVEASHVIEHIAANFIEHIAAVKCPSTW